MNSGITGALSTAPIRTKRFWQSSLGTVVKSENGKNVVIAPCDGQAATNANINRFEIRNPNYASNKVRFNIDPDYNFSVGLIKLESAGGTCSDLQIAAPTNVHIFSSYGTRITVGSTATTVNGTFTAASTSTFTGAVTFTATPRFNSGNTTGAGTALLSTNCPAVTASAPYTWVPITTSDGSTGYIPVWK
jgi:hypothetical protein